MARSRRRRRSPDLIAQAGQVWLGTAITLRIALMFTVAVGLAFSRRMYATRIRPPHATSRRKRSRR